MQLLNDKIDGSGSPENVLPATEWNQVPSELQNIITALGMTLSNGDLNQLGKALSGYAANGSFFTDSGAANAYILTPIGGKQVHPDYEDGDEVEFIAANPNTGASTVNVAGKGVKNIKLENGEDPWPGDIRERTKLKFDNGNDWFELVRETSLVQLRKADPGYTNGTETLTDIPGLDAVKLKEGRTYRFEARLNASPANQTEGIKFEITSSIAGSAAGWSILEGATYQDTAGFNAPRTYGPTEFTSVVLLFKGVVQVDNDVTVTMQAAKGGPSGTNLLVSEDSRMIFELLD